MELHGSFPLTRPAGRPRSSDELRQPSLSSDGSEGQERPRKLEEAPTSKPLALDFPPAASQPFPNGAPVGAQWLPIRSPGLKQGLDDLDDLLLLAARQLGCGVKGLLQAALGNGGLGRGDAEEFIHADAEGAGEGG